MCIKETTAFTTEDGKIFINRDEAYEHTFKLHFFKWYNKNSLETPYTSSGIVPAEVVYEWLHKHSEDIVSELV